MGLTIKNHLQYKRLTGHTLQHIMLLFCRRARPLRLAYAGTLYHVTSRGDRREAIYRNEIDPEAWLEGWPQSASACIGWCTPIVRCSTTTTCCLEAVEGHLACGIRQLATTRSASTAGMAFGEALVCGALQGHPGAKSAATVGRPLARQLPAALLETR